jgi:prepilin-type N-terminal cleavage/methylation domain-containing protein
LKNELNSGFNLVEMLVAMAILGLITLGARQMLVRSQESSLREGLRQTQADMSQDLTRLLNHHYKRHTAKNVTAPHRLVMALPSGQVIVETICMKNDLDWQAPGTLLNRCVKCPGSERPVIRVRDLKTTKLFPGDSQKPDRPAAASICFQNGSDPSEVGIIVEMLVVDPVNRTEKKVSKFDSFLIKDSSTFTSFE